jgi:hypothetical protein
VFAQLDEMSKLGQVVTNNLQQSPGSKTANLKSRRMILISVIVLLGVIALRAAVLKDYLLSTLLIHDDTIFVGSFMFGAPVSGPKAQVVFYSTLRFLASGGSEIPPKLYMFTIQAVILLSFYRIVLRFGGSHIIAVGLSLFAVGYPVSADQNYFMSGAHPAAATAVFMIFCVLYVESLFRNWISEKKTYLVFLLVQGGLLFACGFSSPTFTLIPLVLVPATILAILVGSDARKLTVANGFLGLLSLLPMVVYYAAIHHHHYSELVGWTNYSSEQMFGNFAKALKYIFVYPFAGQPVALVGYVVGMGIVVLSCIISVLQKGSGLRIRLNGKLLALLVVLLISAAFTFGPSSILSHYLSRYIVPPTLISFLTLAVLLTVLLRQVLATTSTHTSAVYAGIGLLATVATFHNMKKTNAELVPYLRTNALMKSALAGVSVSDMDQLLVMLPAGYTTPTAGYNHWSTWYLRVLTGNPTIIGLVGADSMRSKLSAADLFINQYKDHDPEYWGVKDGISYRKQMKGLELNRRLYVLAPDGGGEMNLRSLLFWHESVAAITPPGQSVGRMNLFSEVTSQDCDEMSADNVFVVSGTANVPANDRFRQIISTKFNADAETFQKVGVPADLDEPTFLTIVLSAKDTDQAAGVAEAYTNTYPPMPLSGPDFSVYLAEGAYRVWSKDQGAAQSVQPAQSGKALTVSMVGCPGKFALLSANNEYAGVISNASFSGTWTLGKGFLDRYWAGEIESFSVGTLSE